MDKNKLLKHGILLIASIILFILAISNIKCDGSKEIKESNRTVDIEVVKYKYNNHTYIVFRNEYHNRAGLTHDPDCEKCKENIKLFLTEILKDSIK